MSVVNLPADELAAARFLKTLETFEDRYMINASQISTLAAMRPAALRDFFVRKGFIRRVGESSGGRAYFAMTNKGRIYGLVSRKPKFCQINQILMTLHTGDCLLQFLMEELEASFSYA